MATPKLFLKVVFTTSIIAQRCCNVNKFGKKKEKTVFFTVFSFKGNALFAF